MTEKIKKLCNSCKDIILVFINWEKESVLAFLLKLILVAGGIYLIVNMLPLILGVMFIGILCWWDKSDSINLTQPTQYMVPNQYHVRDILTTVLRENARLLDIMSPLNVADITPTEYPVVKSESGAVFYRFIVQAIPDKTYDFESMCDVINTKIKQKLNAGYPDIPASVFGNVQSIMTINMGFDIFHTGYLYVDIIPITSQVQLVYMYSKLRKPCCVLPRDFNPLDEDF